MNSFAGSFFRSHLFQYIFLRPLLGFPTFSCFLPFTAISICVFQNLCWFHLFFAFDVHTGKTGRAFKRGAKIRNFIVFPRNYLNFLVFFLFPFSYLFAMVLSLSVLSSFLWTIPVTRSFANSKNLYLTQFVSMNFFSLLAAAKVNFIFKLPNLFKGFSDLFLSPFSTFSLPCGK